jgi:predicted acylesterase/phospholipase RssA
MAAQMRHAKYSTTWGVGAMSEQSKPSGKSNQKNTQESSQGIIWSVIIGIVFFWVFGAAAVQQRGLISGYFLACAIVYVFFAWIAVALVTKRLIARYSMPILAWSLLAAWLYFGGTYSWIRDTLVAVVIVPLVLFANPESRLWLCGLPNRLREWWFRPPADSANNSPEAVAQRKAQLEELWRCVIDKAQKIWKSAKENHDKQPATSATKTPVKQRLSSTVIVMCAVATWLGLSGLDFVMEAYKPPLPRNGNVLKPPSMPKQYENLRVGVALSGGGYRAALVHAGVIKALGDLGIPVTHLSSVSGGSIIGSFLSVGGNPNDFVAAVASGRFRIIRDLMTAQNAFRLPSPARIPYTNVVLLPFGQFSRLDVQSSLMDRVLLEGTEASPQAERRGPALIVCMTDLTYGMSVGALDDGFLLVGPTTSQYFRSPEAIEFPALTTLSKRVAVSGSFPGAFPALPVMARITTVPKPLTSNNPGQELMLLLADGGIRDNLGLRLLEAADALAREKQASSSPDGWNGFSPPADWALDLILVSDGGKFIQSASNLGLLSSISRAIDLSGIETGIMRPIINTKDHLTVVLSALGTIAPFPDKTMLGISQTALRDQQYQFFRPTKFNDDLLARIVALVPDQVAAQSAITAYRSLPSGFTVSSDKLVTLKSQCEESAIKPDDIQSCEWWRLVSVVGQDIWSVAEVFFKTETLADSFDKGQAEAIFRFGQYMTLLKAPEIQQALEYASVNKSKVK